MVLSWWSMISSKGILNYWKDNFFQWFNIDICKSELMYDGLVLIRHQVFKLLFMEGNLHYPFWLQFSYCLMFDMIALKSILVCAITLYSSFFTWKKISLENSKNPYQKGTWDGISKCTCINALPVCIGHYNCNVVVMYVIVVREKVILLWMW